MTLNQVLIEGKVEAAEALDPRRSRKLTEIVIRFEGEGGQVEYLPVAMETVEGKHGRPRAGDWVLVVGSLAQRPSLEPSTGDVRYEVKIEGKEIRKLEGKRAPDR